MPKKDSIGGIGEDEIAATWQQLGAPPADAGATPFARFCIHIAALISARTAAEETGDFALFLMTELMPQDRNLVQTDHMPLLEAGNDQISGACWLASPSLRDAYRLQIPCANQTLILQSLRSASLGSHPAILLDRRGGAPKVYAYPKGMACPEERDELIVEDHPITELELKAALDRFYETTLRTPRAASEGHALKIWKAAAKGIPEERPEERIQGRAVDHLRQKFPRHFLRAEPVTEDGRIDITMFVPVLSNAGHKSIRYDWVLELKALCDRTSRGTAVGKSKISAAIKSGLEQLVLYRDGLNANRGALCCYDMREADEGADTCFAAIAHAAGGYATPLWRWYLYRSTELSRKAKGVIAA